jgi:hypothetical protein
MMRHIVVCESCPIYNKDCTCGLGYFVRVWWGAEHGEVFPYSPDCELEIIKYSKNKEFKPPIKQGYYA